MFYTKLKAIYSGLTYSEIKIADYILANQESVTGLTSQQLADLLGLGQSTIIRFSQKMGYKSYRNMLLDLERSQDETEEKVEEIQMMDSIATTNEKIKLRIQHLLDVTTEVNAPGDFEQAVEMIRKAKIIFCFGFLSTGSVADHMNGLLQLFGFNSFCLDGFSTMSAMRNHGEDGLLLAFSKSGETAMTNRVARYAKERGLKVVGITNMAPNTMASYLDVWLKAVHSTIRTRFLHYTETLPLFFIVDCLILNLYKQDFSYYSDCVAEHVAITKSMRGVRYIEEETDGPAEAEGEAPGGKETNGPAEAEGEAPGRKETDG